jgi:hypothetical protein
VAKAAALFFGQMRPPLTAPGEASAPRDSIMTALKSEMDIRAWLAGQKLCLY